MIISGQQSFPVLSRPRPLDLLSNDRSTLESHEWQLLSNVVHAFDKFMPTVETRRTIERLTAYPVSATFDLPEVLAMFANFYTSIESFISSSTDFQILTIDEKFSLCQRNIHGVLNLGATTLLRMSGMFDGWANENMIISVYGDDVFQRTKRIGLLLDDNIVLIKLLLIVLTFSSNCYIVKVPEQMHSYDPLLLGTFRLFGSQNAYVEALWKYMTYRYDYYEASMRFARLMLHLLHLLRMSGEMQQNNDLHQSFVEEITVLTEQTLIANDNEVVPLWGKT